MKTIGISGKKFLTMSFMILTLMFICGIVLNPEMLNGVGHFAFEGGIKVVIAIFLLGIQAYGVFFSVMDLDKERLEEINNLSYSIMAAGIMASTGIIMLNASGITLKLFTASIYVQGSLAIALGVVLSTLFALGRMKVRSMDELKDELDNPGLNNNTIWMTALYVLGVTLVMSV